MLNIKKILVPTDFSENATAVFDYVKRISEKYGARIDLIYILPDAPYQIFKSKDAKQKDNSEEISRLKKRLEEESHKYFGENKKNKVFIGAGRPSNGIIQHAQKEKYDLIIISSRGRGDSLFSRGSVTERLIRLAKTPVLSTNKGYATKIDTIVVPTDGSQVSLEALPMALFLASKNNATIHLLSIYVFESLTVRALGGDEMKYSDKELKELILKNLKKFTNKNNNRLSFSGEPSVDNKVMKINNEFGEEVDVQIKIRKGFSAHTPIKEYVQKNAQLVVMATHGRSAMANLFLGSTTEKLIRQLRKPVLTFKPEFAKK